MNDMTRLLSVFATAFPSHTWSYGFSSPDPVRHLATAWLTNRQPSHIGFDNQPNRSARYYAAEGATIEEAAAKVLRKALAMKEAA